MRGLVAGVVLLAGVAHAELARFFVMGDGRLALEHAHTKARADVRYRRADATYDPAALAKIERAFGGEMSLRLIEVLSHLQHESGARMLRLVSGYRSPTYNERLRAKGVRAASGSLHTEGLAADVAFPRPKLRHLWLGLRALECCGAGYYEKQGFLHVDVGRARFWEPATSRVEENLSAGNARLFARTEFDRYRVGEPMVVTLHALTAPPVRVARDASLAGERVTLEGAAVDAGGCLDVPRSGTAVRVTALAAPARGPLVLSTCAPRPEATPASVSTTVVEVTAPPAPATPAPPSADPDAGRRPRS